VLGHTLNGQEMGIKHLSPAGVASGLYAALMNVSSSHSALEQHLLFEDLRSSIRNSFRARRVVAAWPCNRNRQSVNGQEEWIDENENTLIAGVASSFIEALRADRFPLSNEQMGQL
jgi:hypothetical protein